MITPISLKNNKIVVLGLGKAGMSAINALRRAQAQIYAWDDFEPARKKLANANLEGVNITDPDQIPWDEINLLVMSPGIPLTHPTPHKAVALAKQAGCKIICDIEILYKTQSKAKFLGITGTNGKSTTTALVGHILKQTGINCEIGGNIGIPALDLEPLSKDGVYAIEMSSYQLDLIDQMHFNISVFLNITPDHISRHGDIDGYIAAKCHIYDNQGKNDYAIIGIDDEYTKMIYEKLKSEKRIGTIIPISTIAEIEGGITVKNGVIYDNIIPSPACGGGLGRGLKQTPQQITAPLLTSLAAREEEFTPSIYQLGNLEYLPGSHNGQNIATAFACSQILGVKTNDIIPAIKSFKGLKHRIQMVEEIGGIKFINDSKATNADATANALRAYNDIYWILGGQTKEGGIDSLTEFFPKIRHAFLIGAAQDQFAKTLDGRAPYTKCETLANAFEQAAHRALNEDHKDTVVLLSPACASWDQWPNFEVRGDAFCEMVEKLQEQ